MLVKNIFGAQIFLEFNYITLSIEVIFYIVTEKAGITKINMYLEVPPI